MILLFCVWIQIAIKNCFIRGSVVRYSVCSTIGWGVSVNVFHLLSRYVQIPASEVDTDLLQDAARKENAPK
jgi:hypothetical protein